MFVDSVYSLPQSRTIARASLRANGFEVVAGVALLGIALVVGLATARDYGLTVDEFNTDDYGPKALAWYLSAGADRAQFETVEQFLWYYGPWHQILTAVVQSLGLTDPHTARHAMTFLAGLAGLAALIPLASLTVGRWAGPVAIALCLLTGYFYGSLFFTPIDVPFMAAITWAICAILIMARSDVPSWPATLAVGLFSGLAMSTRPAGIITHAYVMGAMALCALAVAIRQRRNAGRALARIGLRTLAAIALAWLVAIVLWPWLQIGNPWRQFATAYLHFTTNPMAFNFPSWGESLATNALPWHYVPGQLLARLPEGFLILLALALLLGSATAVRFARLSALRFTARGLEGLVAPALVLSRARGTMLVIAAAIVPIGFVIVTQATHYDGIRHLLFVIPLLALLAGGACLRLLHGLRRLPLLAATLIAAAAAHAAVTAVTLARLHPLEYVAMNALAGGTKGAAGRFELDYWAVAATEALRRLEDRLDRAGSSDLVNPPRVLVCITDRHWMADKLFRRNFVLETEMRKADFIIDSERWPCGDDSRARLIEEVKRDDVVFARVYDNRGRAR